MKIKTAATCQNLYSTSAINVHDMYLIAKSCRVVFFGISAKHRSDYTSVLLTSVISQPPKHEEDF
jgi:hypothetical protein